MRRKLLSGWIVWLGLAAGAIAADVPAPEAVEEFAKHNEAGTVLDVKTLQEFHKNGWQRDYALLIRDRWKGREADGVALKIEPLGEHVYRVGEAFDCRATITNKGQQARSFVTGGSCGMTDDLSVAVISLEDGQWFTLMGIVGGPHCFCKPKQQIAAPNESLELAAGFSGKTAVHWKPTRAGRYVIVGSYALPKEDGKRPIVYSPPVEFEVKN